MVRKRGEEAARGKWQPQGDPRDADENREEARASRQTVCSRHITEKRLGSYSIHSTTSSVEELKCFERKGHMDDSFEGEEENGLPLNERNFFPEYNYDWWEKSPLKRM